MRAYEFAQPIPELGYGPPRMTKITWAMAVTTVAMASISRIISVVVMVPLFRPARHVR